MRYLRQFIAGLLLSLSLAAGAQAPAFQDAQHQQVVTQLAQEMRLLELMLRGLRGGLQESFKRDPEALARWLDRIDRPEFAARANALLLPFFGHAISKEQALAFDDFLATSAGQKINDYWYRNALDPSLKLEADQFTASERQELDKVLDKNSPLAAGIGEFKKTMASVAFKKTFSAFIAEEGRDLPPIPARQLADQLEQSLKDPAAAARGPAPTATGNDTFDTLFAPALRRSLEIRGDYDEAIQRAELGDLFSPQTLTSPATIQTKLKNLAGLRKALMHFTDEIRASRALAIKEGRHQALADAQNKRLVTQWESGVNKGAVRTEAFIKNQYALLDLYDELLKFALAQRGKIRADNDEPLFDSDKALKRYNALLERINRAIAEENQLTTAALDQISDLVSTLRGETSSPQP